ncbi:MAG TPA: hypothetical protein VJU59_27315 [Paraburkholderia sp.]|uniref:hypothetical protein n=1 Tax=Paraburkholderia sp. TaxID=1926495 RepID=UPI002B4642F0|nr:hypothetical protein [Paraburkholderia sp.]HKR43349.1 hypothetical protein [Paraburkholderia sp.]
MEVDDLQAAYDAFVTVRGKFEDQSIAMIRGDSSDIELLARLLCEHNAAQRRFSAIATQITAEKMNL